MESPITDDKLIDLAGGATAVAALCGEEVNTVSNWKGRKRIPRGWKRFLAEKLPDLPWFAADAAADRKAA